LLDRPPRSLEGTRRNLTVLFADVRGFTDFFEKCSLEAENYVKENKLSEELADEFIERNAKEVLLTINKYLCVIADVIKKHDGTLDKYIGDCVMAFWGAPMEKEHHAHACIQAAIEIQQAVTSLNEECERSNREMPRPDEVADSSLNLERKFLPILEVGCALGSGWATAGCMGSENHLSNYTVFGQIVNIVSRLESIARGGEIIATESTFNEIIRDHPGLAASFLPREPATLRGIQHPIPIYEIPWAMIKTE
jgi:adenylate cyclase